jgi:hypothetical protein
MKVTRNDDEKLKLALSSLVTGADEILQQVDQFFGC